MKLTAFLSSCFPTWPQIPGQKFIYLKKAKKFWDEIKNIFHHFQRASKYQKLSNCLRTESRPLKLNESDLFHCIISAKLNSIDFKHWVRLNRKWKENILLFSIIFYVVQRSTRFLKLTRNWARIYNRLWYK